MAYKLSDTWEVEQDEGKDGIWLRDTYHHLNYWFDEAETKNLCFFLDGMRATEELEAENILNLKDEDGNPVADKIVESARG